jgi:hypothetical protein
MSLECQRYFCRRYPAAIVRDFYQADAPAPYLHPNLISPGVQRVFHQLLDHRGRSLHDLAGGYLGYRIFIEDFNGHVTAILHGSV